MPLVTLNELLPQARAEKRAVCAFNVTNCESAKAVFMAAEQEQCSVIVQVFQRLFNDDKARYVGAMVRNMAENCDLPVALHLDHGQSIDQVRQAIDYGYTSVMFDGSKLPFEENIAQTKIAVGLAHAAGCSIEGEIGHIPVAGSGELPLSTPEEAVDFARETGVDALAVAIGTAHGFYKEVPTIHIDLAKRISAAVDIPLVLHGGSDTPEERVREAISCGFAKLNIASEFFNVFLEEVINESNKRGENFIPIDIFMNPVTEAMSKLAVKKIQLCKNR